MTVLDPKPEEWNKPTKRLDEINWDPTLGMPHGGVGDNGVREPVVPSWDKPKDAIRDMWKDTNDLARYKEGSPAGKLCAKAASLIDGDREKKHGDKNITHTVAAALWGVYLGIALKAEDVATCMELLKIARAKHGEYNPDDYIDRVGYAAIAGEHADAGC